MRICICIFGLFHRPKSRGSTYNLIQNSSGNQNNSNSYMLKIRRRSFLFPTEQQNKLKEINKRISHCMSPELKPRVMKEKKSLYELKDKFRCLFCGGTKCPYEDYKYNPKSSIKGLNCDLIDNEIYASQRPSNTLIEEYNLIKKFHQYKIGMIINLQRPGEHPYCGRNALDPLSGYSYSPSLFSSEGIIVKLAGWKDMDVPDSLYFMLDIIKDIYKKIKIEKKRVLVHCHAGYGRTGIVIACYLIYKSNYQAEEAVKYLRNIRKKCVENKSQMKYCIKFRQFLNTLRKIFTHEKNDVDYYIKHQCDLEIEPVKKNLYIPKLFWLTFDILTELKNNNCNDKIYKALNGSLDATEENFKEILDMKEKIDSGDWDCLIHNQNIIVVSEILYHWLEECVSFCVRPKKIIELSNDKKLMFQLDEILLGDVDEENIETIYSSLNNYLKKVEIKILNYIAKFLVKIYPVEGIDDIIEYKRMVEKISVYILGFNIDLLYNYKLQFETKNNNKINNTLTQLNKGNEGEEIDSCSGLTLFNCIKAVECTILILECLKIKISFPNAKKYKDKIVLNTNGEFTKQFNSLRAKTNLLKSVIVTKESDVFNLNNSNSNNLNNDSVNNIYIINKDTNGTDNSLRRRIKYNLFSEKKPFEKIENQIKIFKERSLTPYRKKRNENKKKDKKVSKFCKQKENE